MAIVIRDNGRGPEIVGTGVSVFDVMDAMRYRLEPMIIDSLFDLELDDGEAAVGYVQQHRTELEPAYQRFRDARGGDFPLLERKAAEIEQEVRERWERERDFEPGGGFPAWTDFDKPFIFNRGRGPEIVMTRVTVYTIMDYRNWPSIAVAWWLRLTLAQVEAARKYIDEHRTEVEKDYREIVERGERGNPPELQAKLDALKGTARTRLEELKAKKRLEQEHAQPAGGS
jgi:uncharacterized protein (DUF433 family)